MKISMRILLFFILFTALFARLIFLDSAEFKSSEALFAFKALLMLDEGGFPLTACVSGNSGINEPPLTVYLLAIPFFFSRNPILATGFIALLNFSAVLLCFIHVKRQFGFKAAMISAAFYAVNPWAVLYSRKIWQVDMLSPFIMLFVLFFFKTIYENNKKYIIPSMGMLACIIQIHISSFYFVFIFLILICRYWKVIEKKYLMYGGLLFLFLFSPYILFQIQNDFVIIKNFLNHMGSGKTGFNYGSVTLPFLQVSTDGFKYSLGDHYSDFINQTVKFDFLDIFTKFCLAVALIFLFVRPQKGAFLLRVWAVAGICFIMFSKTRFQYYYNLAMLPLIFIVMGNLFGRLIENRSTLIRYASYVAVTVLIAYQLNFTMSFLRYVDSKECLAGDYGPSYNFHRDLVQNALNDGIPDYNHIDYLCQCHKCDELATHFIIYSLRKNYEYERYIPNRYLPVLQW